MEILDIPDCVKCGSGVLFNVEYWDGKYDLSGFASIFDYSLYKEYRKHNESAHERECLICTCETCGYKFNIPTKDKP